MIKSHSLSQSKSIKYSTFSYIIFFNASFSILLYFYMVSSIKSYNMLVFLFRSTDEVYDLFVYTLYFLLCLKLAYEILLFAIIAWMTLIWNPDPNINATILNNPILKYQNKIHTGFIRSLIQGTAIHWKIIPTNLETVFLIIRRFFYYLLLRSILCIFRLNEAWKVCIFSLNFEVNPKMSYS